MLTSQTVTPVSKRVLSIPLLPFSSIRLSQRYVILFGAINCAEIMHFDIQIIFIYMISCVSVMVSYIGILHMHPLLFSSFLL